MPLALAAVAMVATVSLAACSTPTHSTTAPPATASGTPAAGTPTTAGSTTAPASPPPSPSPSPVAVLAAGQSGPLSAVPWPEVGPGWLLADWGPNAGAGPGQTISGNVPANQETTTLFLVDPQGGRYQVATLPPPPSTLVDWSGDGRRALFADSNKVIEVDLTTGTTDAQFSIPEPANGLVIVDSYTRPSGLAVLATTEAGPTETLQRYSLTGSLQQTYPSTFTTVGNYTGGVVESPDGTQIVMGAARGLAVVGNSGSVGAQLTVAGATGCTPERWWASGVVLASCSTATGTPRLWEVPISGTAPTALTATPVAPDYGDMNAWQVGSSVYVEAEGGCGSVYVARLQPNGTTAPVTIPDVEQGDSQFILGTANGQLALRATVSCGGGVSALWFNPSANTSTVVLGPGVNGGGVMSAMTYPNPEG